MIRPFADQTCVVVASGPSAIEAPLDIAIGRAKIIAVNSSWRLAPFADVLFAGDPDWWIESNGCPQFGGMKLTTADNVPFPDVRRIAGISGRNSGHQALMVAVHWGFAKILLVGFDMTTEGGVHWHGPHAVSNPTERMARRWLREIEDQHIPGGVRVINCSLKSAISRFPKMRFDEALA